MANMVKTVDFPKNPKQIMIADSEMISLPVKIADTGVTAADGKKIVKAGTPITGDLKTRNTAFTVATENVVGIVLHDVDVTEGTNNGVVVVFGVVDLEKLESDVQKLITNDIETELNGKIYFTTGSGNAIA
jgi:hypothetical protein